MIEAVIAAALLVATLAGLAGVWTMARRMTATARQQTLALQLAHDKLEQLANLAWSVRAVDGVDLFASDVTTDLSRSPAGSTGAGTLPSPAGSLARSIDGYADYLDAHGRWVGAGSGVPAGARFVRRWSMARHGDVAEMLLFQVLVTTVAAAREPSAGSWWRHPDVVWLCGAKLRRRV